MISGAPSIRKRQSPAATARKRKPMKSDITLDMDNPVESYRIFLTHPDSPYQKFSPERQDTFRKSMEKIIAKRQDIG